VPEFVPEPTFGEAEQPAAAEATPTPSQEEEEGPAVGTGDSGLESSREVGATQLGIVGLLLVLSVSAAYVMARRVP
jgi:hypothetical protein